MDELKEDPLEARGEAKSGNKAWLRRRLHTAIVRLYLSVSPRRKARAIRGSIFFARLRCAQLLTSHVCYTPYRHVSPRVLLANAHSAIVAEADSEPSPLEDLTLCL